MDIFDTIFDAYEKGYQASVMGFPCCTELDGILNIAWVDGWVDGEGISALEFDEITEYMRQHNLLSK